MTIAELIKDLTEYAEDSEKGFDTEVRSYVGMSRQAAKEWLKELRVFKARKGQWLRMSNLSEQEDDRYKCSYCGNVIHHKNKMDLYTFNSWCGRCGSDNGRK